MNASLYVWRHVIRFFVWFIDGPKMYQKRSVLAINNWVALRLYLGILADYWDYIILILVAAILKIPMEYMLCDILEVSTEVWTLSSDVTSTSTHIHFTPYQKATWTSKCPLQVRESLCVCLYGTLTPRNINMLCIFMSFLE